LAWAQDCVLASKNRDSALGRILQPKTGSAVATVFL
jgi:hypothetical protein